MTKATRSTTVRDFLIFQLKLALDGLKDMTLSPLSLGALLIDLIRGRGEKPRLFYRVMELGERFDLWLNLYAPASGAEDDADGLFGRSRAGGPTMVGQLEQLVRGGDSPRGSRRSGGPGRTPRSEAPGASAA